MKISTIKKWDEMVVFINHYFENYAKRYVHFRGQPNYEWRLNPSLTRIVKGNNISEQKAKYYETQSQIEFKSKAHLLDKDLTFDSKMDLNALLTDMQHYSCPTRLLDWSDSPFVALYFAVSEYLEIDGALFVLDIGFFDRNIKECFPNILEPEAHEITNFSKYDMVSIIYAIKSNHRLAKQQGCFSISNNLLKSHDEIICDVAERVQKESGLIKIIIPKQLKVEFLARLKTMNITAESLFPGLDGLGRSIRDELYIRKWRKK